MRIECLGVDGAPAPGAQPMCLLLDGVLLLDAGAAASALAPERAGGVKAVLLSHAHLDHVRELGFLPFRRDPERDGRLQVLGTAGVIDAVRTAVFNPAFWVDFEDPKPPRKSGIVYRVLETEAPSEVAGFRAEAVPLTHAGYETSGFLLEREGRLLVTAFDSGPTERLWERVRGRGRVPDLVLFDVSFPDRLAPPHAEHLTPAGIAVEIGKLGACRPRRVAAVHLKPEHRDEVRAEISSLPFPVEVPSSGETIVL